MARIGCRAHPLDGERVIVDQLVSAARHVLDGRTSQAGRDRLPERLGYNLRRIAERVAEIGVHRQVCRIHNVAHVSHRFVTARRVVTFADGEREAGARCR